MLESAEQRLWRRMTTSSFGAFKLRDVSDWHVLGLWINPEIEQKNRATLLIVQFVEFILRDVFPRDIINRPASLRLEIIDEVHNGHRRHQSKPIRAYCDSKERRISLHAFLPLCVDRRSLESERAHLCTGARQPI